MALTTEEKRQVIHACIHGKFWPSDCEPPKNKDGTTNCPENDRLLTEEHDGQLMGRDDLTQQEYFDKFYSIIVKLRGEGRLIRRTAAPTVDAATTLPHDNIKELKNIRNLADVKRIANLPKEELKQLANLKPGSPAFTELNARLAYIRLHQIGKNQPPTVVDQTEKSKSENSADGGYNDARAVVDAVTNKDVGSVGSGPGQSGWDKANKFKTRVGRIIDGEEKKGTSGPAVLKWVLTERENLRSSSIK